MNSNLHSLFEEVVHVEAFLQYIGSGHKGTIMPLLSTEDGRQWA